MTQTQLTDFWNNLQTYLPFIQANGAMIAAIILLFMIWALKSQILREHRRFLRELKQELRKTHPDPAQTPPASDHVKANLIEQKIIIHQELVNLKAEHAVELQSLGGAGLPAKRYYHYFKAFKDLVISNRFYMSQESEFVFSRLMQDNAAVLLKLNHLEHEFTELANEAPTDRYALEQLTEQETIALEAFYQASQTQMERFLEMIDRDALALRAEISS